MALVAGSVVIAGCGRLDFDRVELIAADVAPIGHDEDGDGLGDTADPCPHVSGDDGDRDGDGVGDACDPDPAVAGDRIRVFSTLRAGDHPFADISPLVQEDDGLSYAGDITGLNLLLPLANGRFEIGFDIRALVGTGQHQIASGVEAGTQPYYFTELNENVTGLKDVAVVSYDATNGYQFLGSVPHGGMHPGAGILRFDVATSPPTFTVVAGWVGELYTATASTPEFSGGTGITVVFNGLDFVMRYVVMIDSAP